MGSVRSLIPDNIQQKPKSPPMKKHQSQSSQSASKQNEYVFWIDDQRSMVISSKFQNGNISLVKQVNELHYILQALSDRENGGNRKCWFYFKVKAEKGIKVRLIVQNVNIYENIYQEGLHCKPMMKEGPEGEWLQSTDSFLTYRDEVVLVIEHSFKNSEEVYFCMTVPFTYSDNEQYLQNLRKFVHQNISYEDTILCQTPNQHNVHLLTITEYRGESKQKKDCSNREEKKPVVLITARVHPGEVSASYCLQGILDFLMGYHNLQAYLLRRLFIFKIIPMLNPDGVVEGNYRADPQGFNLNRFYLDPDPQQHPAIFSIMELVKTLNSKQKIQYYFDLHSHSSFKESFIYGNAFEDLVSQTYSQLFCKILEENFPRFRYYLSNFGQSHMRHKDKGESMSKEGCGRVVISKFCGFPSSYTVESSIFPSSYHNFIKKNVKSMEKNIDFTKTSDPPEEVYYFDPIYSQGHNQNIIIAENKRLGKAMMISILDMLEKNPYTRLKEGFNVTFFKQASSKLLQNEQRFKLMDMKAYQKAKNIAEYIKNKFQDPLDRAWNISGLSFEINKGPWPQEFRKIAISNDPTMAKVSSNTNFKKIRMNTEGKEKTSMTISIKKQKNRPKHVVTESSIDPNVPETHRTISPLTFNQQKPLFPEIKYSVEMKLAKKESFVQKTSSIKEMNFITDESDNKNGPKKMLIDYINDQMSKISPQKQTLKRNNSSLNRMIANKIIQRQKSKNKASQMNSYQNMMMIESRKRIITECKEGETQEVDGQNKHKERYTMNEDEVFRALQLKKTDIIKKRLLLTNKAVQILKKSDRAKVKLPQVSKINLVVSNSIRERCIHTEGSESQSQKEK